MIEQIGPYRIDRELGRGGMGEVYRARDTRLDRDVAIKALPEHLAHDPDRLARFEREAKTLAQLNHPNVAGIYGVEEHEGARYLVLEYVEGETLTARLARGALPVDEALEIAVQIAAGVEAAHDAGVIHRDLKPGNVIVTPEGKTKVLDFGLARAEEASSSAMHGMSPDSPTLTSPAVQHSPTMPGVILGTAAYMSPEQARGRAVDKRTDIWSFGIILHECLTGSNPYVGETVTDSIGAILHKEPEWSALPPGTPTTIQLLLRRCLAKDRSKRLRDIGDARIEIENAIEDPTSSLGLIALPTPERRIRGAGLAGVLATAVVASAVVWAIVKPTSDLERRPVRLRMALDETLDISGLAFRTMAISPDGSKVVYSAGGGGVTHLYVRRFGSEKLQGTEGGRSPFFSPDGERVGFFSQGFLKWVSLSGGAPLTLAVAPGLQYGGDWLPDGRIIFTSAVTKHLFVVSENGGEAKPFRVTPYPGEPGVYRWPHALPDGKHFLLTFSGAINGIDGPHVVVVSLKTGEARRLTRGSDAKYVQPGHLLVGQGTEALVAPFDLKRLSITATPRSIGLKAATDAFGALSAVVARNGTLVYQPPAKTPGGRLAWVQRDGSAHLISESVASYMAPRLSADNKQLAFWGGLEAFRNTGVALYDLDRDHWAPLTLEHAGSAYPTWAPDQKTILFLRFETSGFSIRSVAADGSGTEHIVLTHNRSRVITSFAPDGRTGLLYEVNPITNRDIWLWSEEAEPRVLINTPFNERAGTIAPNGQWFAYVSDQSGADQVYVTSYPDANGRWRVSTDGGTEPRWNPDGKELFYRVQDRMMGVPVDCDADVFVSGAPVELFRGAFLSDPFGNANYDIASDGRRFLMVQGQAATDNELMVVLNWTAELRE